jgi:TonB family protein
VAVLYSRASSPNIVRVDELSLRQAATKVVMPEFPKEAIKRNVSGLAVIQIVFDENGQVEKTKILEAPDILTGNAVVLAVKQWRFQPQKVNGDPVSIQGKLTFYFVIDRPGVGRVVNPKQVS